MENCDFAKINVRGARRFWGLQSVVERFAKDVTKIALARDQRKHEKDENLAPQSLRIALLCGEYNEFMNLQ